MEIDTECVKDSHIIINNNKEIIHEQNQININDKDKNQDVESEQEIEEVEQGNNINCSIINNEVNNLNEEQNKNSGLKIKFKLNNKKEDCIINNEEGRRKKKKKNNNNKIINKLIIKNIHGNINIMEKDKQNEKTKEVEKDKCRNENSSEGEINCETKIENNLEKSLEKLNHVDLSNDENNLEKINEFNESIEKNHTDQTNIDSTDKESNEKNNSMDKDHSSNVNKQKNIESTNLNDLVINKEASDCVNTNEITNVDQVPDISQNENLDNLLIKKSDINIKIKRKPKSRENLSTDNICNEKTDILDCNKQITPWTKRRKISNATSNEETQTDSKTNKSESSNQEEKEMNEKSSNDEELEDKTNLEENLTTKSSQDENNQMEILPEKLTDESSSTDRKVNEISPKENIETSVVTNSKIPKRKLKTKRKECQNKKIKIENDKSEEKNNDIHRGFENEKEENQTNISGNKSENLDKSEDHVEEESTKVEVNEESPVTSEVQDDKNKIIENKANADPEACENVHDTSEQCKSNSALTEPDLKSKTSSFNHESDNTKNNNKNTKMVKSSMGSVTNSFENNSLNLSDSTTSSDTSLNESKSSLNSSKTSSASPSKEAKLSFKRKKEVTKLEDFLSELNEESKNIKEGDEIPIDDEEENNEGESSEDGQKKKEENEINDNGEKKVIENKKHSDTILENKEQKREVDTNEAKKDDIIENTKKSENITVQKEETVENTEESENITIQKEETVENTEKSENIIIQKEETVENTEKSENITLQKKETVENTEKSENITMQKKETVENTEKSENITMQKEETVENTEKSENITIQKEETVENNDVVFKIDHEEIVFEKENKEEIKEKSVLQKTTKEYSESSMKEPGTIPATSVVNKSSEVDNLPNSEKKIIFNSLEKKSSPIKLQGANISADLDMSSEDSSDSSEDEDGSDSSDDSSSSGSSSDSDSSSDSESGSDSSDSGSSDSERERPVQIAPQPNPNVVRHKKLKIRNAPSLSQDSLIKSESSSSNPTKDPEHLEVRVKIENRTEGNNDDGDEITSPQSAAPVGTLSQQILSGSSSTPLPVKRKPGRPRKNPLPDSDQGTPTVGSTVEKSDDVPEQISGENANIDGEYRPQVCRRGRQKGYRKKKRGRPKKNAKESFFNKHQSYISKAVLDPNAPRRKRGRPKKNKDSNQPESTSKLVDLSGPYIQQDQLSEELMQLNSQFNLMVDIPGITPVDDQNSSEITDNRLLEELNSELDVITEEIVSEDVSNYLGNPVNDILKFQDTKPKSTTSSQHEDDSRSSFYSKNLKTDDPCYHKKYYKYVKIPKDQQKKRGPKKRATIEMKPKRIKSDRKRGRPRKSENLGARPVKPESRWEEDQQDQQDQPYDDSLSKELENLNRSMENILTDEPENDKDFIVSHHVKFESLSEDQVKRSNRPSKSQVPSFAEFENEIDELIEMAATEEKAKPKYKYYEKIPKHLQKKRGRPRKSENADEQQQQQPKKEPKPKVERPPKQKKTIVNEDGIEVKLEEDYIEFDEEDDYDEDIDDEDKDKDFNIKEYLKQGKNGVQIDENLEYEEVYPTKERPMKIKKANQPRFGMFAKKMQNMLPRRNVNACEYRYVTVCDKDFNPIAKVQRMYCVKVAPATYNVADKYKPKVVLRQLMNNDVSDFFEKYWCDECELSFFHTKISKNRHMYIYHTEEVECDLCDRVVSNRANLKKHRELFHQKKVYTCKVCGIEHKKFKIFQMHVWEAHPVVRRKDRAYFCNICQVVFYRKESFKFHYHEHLNGNIFEQFDTSLADMEFMLKQLMMY